MAEVRRDHTIVGTQAASQSDRPTVVLLNRSSRLLRRELFTELHAAGFTDILSIELQANSYSVEPITRAFSGVRCILTPAPMPIGDQIQLAARYALQDQMLVMWSTMAIPVGVDRAMERLRRQEVLAVAPAIRGDRGELLPTLQVPAFDRRTLRLLTLPIRADGGETIAPFDWVALYDRTKLEALGGFDHEIEHPFWQRLDLCFRAHMFGFRIPIVPVFRATYNTMPPAEDQTGDRGYARFFARNLAVRVGEEGGHLPRMQAVHFALRSNLGIFDTIRTFRDAREWILANRHRFVIDPRDLVDKWSIDYG